MSNIRIVVVSFHELVIKNGLAILGFNQQIISFIELLNKCVMTSSHLFISYLFFENRFTNDDLLFDSLIVCELWLF